MKTKRLIAIAAAALALLVGGVAHASAAAGGYQEALAQYAGQGSSGRSASRAKVSCSSSARL
jgi:hypothetical protein